MKYSQDCPLCNLKHKTKWLYHDQLWTICKCISTGRPMIVYRFHQDCEEIDNKEIQYVLKEAESLFGDFKILNKEYQVQDHFHWYLKVSDDINLDDFDDVID